MRGLHSVLGFCAHVHTPSQDNNVGAHEQQQLNDAVLGDGSHVPRRTVLKKSLEEGGEEFFVRYERSIR